MMSYIIPVVKVIHSLRLLIGRIRQKQWAYQSNG